MGTVHRESGFTFRIWSEDHEPPHVHVWKGGRQMLINLSPVGVRNRRGMKDNDAMRALAIVQREREKMLRNWREIHGT
ncbi:DUF4160 domain-containing protein [Longimicrobium sp.]|jgi:hypothetical protein|uniref:DUF4160 domain-containing protein n=1 Tax=Longimicrobium sp. TaxID=2029185 RepID=UPI0039C91C25